MTRVIMTRVKLTHSLFGAFCLMYTISYNTARGWGALGGIALAILSGLLPVVTGGAFGPEAAAVGAVIGSIIAGYSNKPGAPTTPTVVASLPTERGPIIPNNATVITSSGK